MKSISTIAVLATGLAVLAGCSKQPTTEIQAAEQSVSAAQAAGAAEYAPDSYAAVEQAKANLDMELAVQSKKFKPIRSYGKVAELAQTLDQAASKASADAETAKRETMAQATAAITLAKATLDSAMAALDTAPQGKGSQADLDAMRADLMNVRTALTEVESAFDAQKYTEAKAKADAARLGADNVLVAIRTAIQNQQTAKTRKG